MNGLKPSLIVIDDLGDDMSFAVSVDLGHGSETGRNQDRIVIVDGNTYAGPRMVDLLDGLRNLDRHELLKLTQMAEMQIGRYQGIRINESEAPVQAMYYPGKQKAQWKQETRGRPPQHNFKRK